MPGVVAHAFDPRTWEAEAGRFLSSRPTQSTKWFPGQPELYRETLSQKQQQQQQKQTKKNQKNIITFVFMNEFNVVLMSCYYCIYFYLV